VKHSSSQALYAYWNERRGSRAAPERADIEPGAVRSALADSFILALDPTLGNPFRLAGTRICALVGRELRAQPFEEIWQESDRADLNNLIEIVADEAAVIVAGVSGRTRDGDRIDLELLLLPLRHHGNTHARQIGVLAPLNVPFWIGSRPLGLLELGMFRHIGATVGTAPSLPIAAKARGRRLRHGLVIYDGGRS
jgi:hypothetical protein